MITEIKEFRQVYINSEPTLYYVSRDGEVLTTYKGQHRRLKIFSTDKGYLYVKLWINGKTKGAFIHRLVATAYIPNPDNKPEVNHKDGVKSHNYDWNLDGLRLRKIKLMQKGLG
jgi:hypothetical protein